MNACSVHIDLCMRSKFIDKNDLIFSLDLNAKKFDK